MVKLLKTTTAVAAVGFIALFLYANLRRQELVETLPPVHLKIFALDQMPDSTQAAHIRQALRSMPGVTAVSLSPATQTFSVTYRPAQATPASLTSAASLGGLFEVQEKSFPPRPACPVPPLHSIKQKLLASLRIS
jgi:copper chaperone CopZ